MGVLTTAFGGVIRDVLAEEPNAPAAARDLHHRRPAGRGGVREPDPAARRLLAAGIAGFTAAFGLRACAIMLGWSLPGFRGGEDEPA